ncbi:MAG: pyruvate, phosphate dikinase [Thermoplasmata archaeon]|nr:pyruvate, phosphate dikinase [Thermoplasmata archaeon]
MPMKKYVYLFTEGDGKNKKLLGGKGAGLCEMIQIGLPVPPGFVITTEACLEYYERNKTLPEGLKEQVMEAIKKLEEETGKKFGGKPPLLVSVRSGAAISMPGMMDTILNLGLNDETVKALAEATQNERFAYDAYRRFISLFSKIAMGVDDELFSNALEKMKKSRGYRYDTDLTAEDLKKLCEEFKAITEREKGGFPADPYTQLFTAVKAVFESWNGKRCVDYRKEFKITPDMANGTAANVQTMVFGNMGNDSATGVAFTRDPATGENVFYGEYLVNAQGEDVVAGIRTPKPIGELKEEMPVVYQQLLGVREKLEKHFKEVQDLEFTIEKGKLYMLQTRNGKMNAAARVKTAVDFVKEGLITKEEALLRVNPSELDHLMHRRVDPKYTGKPIAVGIPASPGAASGSVIFDADEAERRGRLGWKIILLREETKPEDIHGFFAAQGILTSKGGKTSHAAVVARGMGKPCVTGCEEIKIDSRARVATVGNIKISEGDIITIDGTSGRVWLGEIPKIEPEISEEFKTLLSWADEIRKLGVRANANTPKEAALALSFGAEGIGLCRTERMFNETNRLPIVQEMILADTYEERKKCLDKLLPFQKQDFIEIFKVMKEKPVTIRLLDPPLHEFLPSQEELMIEIERVKNFRKIVEAMHELPETIKLMDPKLHMYLEPVEKVSSELMKLGEQRVDEELLRLKENVLRKVKNLAEVNPMLGHRGVRVGITYPEIYEMQIRAILEAVAELLKQGEKVNAEIMVPQVCTAQELKWVHDILNRVHREVEAKYGIKVPYKFGTMIEVVRACMRAGKLSEYAEFFSFGTNDLTQATFSFSREDAENKFLPLYNEKKILQDNPFEILDVKGVGRLMMITIEWGRKTRPDLKVGICGEHGGEPRSIEFCHAIGVDYVSCSPYRIPIARIAAAQATVKEKMGILKKEP